MPFELTAAADRRQARRRGVSTVPPITDFIQAVPAEGQASTEKTEAWVMFDDDYIYVSGKMLEDVPPEKWTANELRRDTNQLRQNDTFGVPSTRFTIGATASTSTRTRSAASPTRSVTDEGNPNADWNPVWDVRTGRFEGGWTVEMAIPFKSLRYIVRARTRPGASSSGASIRRKNEWTHLTPVPASTGVPGGHLPRLARRRRWSASTCRRRARTSS